ncbi:MAG: chorismate synthase, partial [Myxococcota bacterium]|nr:chorismate synthase [Myxococcota bacterium]MEE2780116.1 chorismate synthase [Myxococcota bacterium]
MSGNTFGHLFRVTTFGESHGPAIGAIVDGCPPDLELCEDDLQPDLDRRRPGTSRLTSGRREDDQVRILSGVFDGRTTGTPIGLMMDNRDPRPGAYDHMKDLYRPSHADFTYDAKYGHRAWPGGGRASARETATRVAAGAIARKLLVTHLGVEIVAWVDQVSQIPAAVDANTVTLQEVAANGPVQCPDPAAAPLMETRIEEARKDGDTVGGVIRCVARGVPAGLGDPVFRKLDATLASAMMGLPAAKGFEVGSGFAGTQMLGSAHNDPFQSEAGQVVTNTNHSGGIQGGISNGMPIDLRVAFKPVA